MRTLYLTRALSIDGRHSLAGRRLYDRLCELSDAFLLGHIVLPKTEELHEAEQRALSQAPALAGDVLTIDAVREFAPDLIYREGGLFSPFNVGQLWKIPRSLVVALVQAGAIVIVADADVNRLSEQKVLYADAADLLGAHANYGWPVSQLYADFGLPDLTDDNGPVMIVDETSHGSDDAREIICTPDRMAITEWLRPVYDGVTGIGVWGAVSLTPQGSSVLASGNWGTAGTLYKDVWVDEQHAAPFATVARVGKGYVVLIAASVSHDEISASHPGNVTWLANVSRYLQAEVEGDRARYRRPAAEETGSVAAVPFEVMQRTYSSLIRDEELRQRTEDLLAAGAHYDRVVREACVILENRVRVAIGADKSTVGVSLMELAFSPKGGPLQLSNVAQEQRGAMQLYSGIMAFFRNDAGHHIVDTYSEDDAWRLVTWIDLLLAMVERARPNC